MKGKKVFTQSEAEAIKKLIAKKVLADSGSQKGIRAKIRRLGFYASDFGVGGGYNVTDFERVVTIIGSSNTNTTVSKETLLKKNSNSSNSTTSTKKKKVSDEVKFFTAFSTLIGADYLKSKSIEKPITKKDIFYTGNYQQYGLEEKVEKTFKEILNKLNSNFNLNNDSLSHHIDGMVFNHPTLGSRIVEFDEEQHFTPALKDALIVQKTSIKNPFIDLYLEILDDVSYLNEVNKKNRLNLKHEKYPKSFKTWIEKLTNEKESGYIEAKEYGFPFLGGRIAQRAYYDCLRNVAHLSLNDKNKNLKSIIRFPKKYFEDKTEKKFSKISEDELIELIKLYLFETYNFKNFLED